MNCKFCTREINNKGSLASHEKVCKENPNRVKHNRSPLAGQQKGSVPWNTGTTVPVGQTNQKYKNEEVFVEDSNYARSLLRRRILKEELIEYRCKICDIGPEWQGKPMVLILDHINGVNNDNRFKNLRFVCSNCDTQLPTYKNKNRK